MERITIVREDGGERVDLGGGSYSNLVLTNKTLLGGNAAMLGYSRFKKGFEGPQKVHVDAEELAYVLSGSGKLTVGEELVDFRRGDCLHIPAGVPHGIRNDGGEDLTIVFFFPSMNYPKTRDARANSVGSHAI